MKECVECRTNSSGGIVKKANCEEAKKSNPPNYSHTDLIAKEKNDLTFYNAITIFYSYEPVLDYLKRIFRRTGRT